MKQSWEAANADEILGRKSGAFADSVASRFVARLVSDIDPKSRMMSIICEFFEYENNFSAFKRPDFPRKRALFNEKKAKLDAQASPFRRRERDLKAEKKRLLKSGAAREASRLRLGEIETELSEISREILAIYGLGSRSYRAHYRMNFVTGRWQKAHSQDVAYLKTHLADEAKKLDRIMQQPFYANLGQLGRLLEWSNENLEAVRLLWAIANSKNFKYLIENYLVKPGDNRVEAFHHLCAIMLGCDIKTVSEIFSTNGELALTGVITPDPKGFMPKFSDVFERLLGGENLTHEYMTDILLGEKASTELELHQNFNYVADHINHVRMLVKTGIEERKVGQNIIVYGVPDSGKTEFVKAIAKALGIPVYMLAEAKADKNQPTPEERLAQVLLAKRITARMEGVLLAIDEAEDLLRIRADDKQSNGVTKVFLNRLLERGYMTIWIVNNIENIDPAVRRRFQYAVPFGALTARDRLAAWQDITQKYGLELEAGVVELLSSRYVTPVGAIVTAVKNAVATTKDVAAIERSLRSMGRFVFNGLSNILTGEKAPAPYFPALENFKEVRSNLGPEAMRQVLTQHIDKPLPVLCYGPRGAGKKAFIKDIAAKTGRECLSYHIRDIFMDEGSLAGEILQEVMNKPCIVIWEGMELLDPVAASHPAVPQVRAIFGKIFDTVPCMHVFSSSSKEKPQGWVKKDFALVLEFGYLKPEQIKQAWPLFFGVERPAGSRNKRPLTPADFVTLQKRYHGLVLPDAKQIDAAIDVESPAAGKEKTDIGMPVLSGTKHTIH